MLKAYRKHNGIREVAELESVYMEKKYRLENQNIKIKKNKLKFYIFKLLVICI